MLAVLVSTVVIVTIIILAVGYRAIDGWRRSGVALNERRANEQATLLAVALDRDMKGVQTSVLSRIGGQQLAFTSPYDLVDTFASAFARFPYPESFFVWRAGDTPAGGESFVFNRSDRLPVWDRGEQSAPLYPVVVRRDPPPLQDFIAMLRGAPPSQPIRLYDVVIGGQSYQALVSAFYEYDGARRLVGSVGFLVNLAWVREHYFDGLARQIASVVGDDGPALSILDERGQLVAATRPLAANDLVSQRAFPLVFGDRGLLTGQAGSGRVWPMWTARAAADPAAGGLPRNWSALWWLMTCAAAAALLGVVLVGRTLRMTAELAEMKSELVSTVTHDLKTPLALIRLVGETLGLGRYSSPETIGTYARMLSTEAARLTLRIDNLLAYARITDARDAYRFETLDLLDVVQESVRRAGPRLRALGFDLDANLTDATTVRADRIALLQVLDNLIDNSLKYSGDSRRIEVRTAASEDTAFVSIRDWGIGIPPDEVAHVFEKFYRARNAAASGSGLGLAIAKRVMADHRGSIRLEHGARGGTVVTLGVPRAEPL